MKDIIFQMRIIIWPPTVGCGTYKEVKELSRIFQMKTSISINPDLELLDIGKYIELL